MAVQLIGIDLGGTNTTVGIVDPRGKMGARATFPSEVHRGPADWVGRVRKAAHELLATARVPWSSLKGVGVGAAGLIDQESGMILQSPNFKGWVKVPAARLLARALRVPAAIDNDVNAMALGEALFGAGRGRKDVFCLTLGTGVGGGIVLDGKLYRGASFSAGEIGHVTIDPDGPFCACGNQGCLEAFVGTAGILRTAEGWARKAPASRLARLARQRKITVKDVADLARKGCRPSREVFRQAAEMLGVGLAGVVNLLNPSVIIVGGRVAQSGDLLFKPLKATLLRRAMSVPARVAQVKPALLGPHAGMIGAAMLTRGYARVFR